MTEQQHEGRTAKAFASLTNQPQAPLTRQQPEYRRATDSRTTTRGYSTMSRTMRAKMYITQVEKFGEPVTQERVSMSAVGKSTGYDETGADEDNPYARYSPSGSLSLTIANPALIGQFESGQKFYLDFTPAE